MSLLDTLRKNLDSETFTKVTDALGDDFNYDLIPRSRLNKVIAQRDEARRSLTGTQSSATNVEDDVEDEDTSTVQQPKRSTAVVTQQPITQKMLDDAVAAAKSENAQELQKLRMQYAITEKLREANFVDPKLVLSANLIDTAKVEMAEDGSITAGLAEQITALSTARPYLINSGNSAPTGTGKEGSTDFGKVTSREEFMKLDTAKQIEFKNANPDVFKSFMSQI